MILFSRGSAGAVLSPQEVREALFASLDRIGKKKRVIAVPPDYTRYHSQAGLLTEMVWEYYGKTLTDVLPAIGSHLPMNDEEIGTMFGKVPRDLFRVHDWRDGVATLGEVPAALVKEVSEGKVDYSIPIQVDKLLASGSHDLILSIGQVVPHEVIGMAGYNKNIFVGTGGAEGINKTHFLGAVFGMERMMGHADSPVRKIFDYGSERFAGHLPIVYVLTVVGKDDQGKLAIKGLFIGDDSGVLLPCGGPVGRSKSPAPECADQESHCVPRSDGIQKHVVGQQKYLPDSDGVSRWWGDYCLGAGAFQVW